MQTIGAPDDVGTAALSDAVMDLVHAWREAARRKSEMNQSTLSILELVRTIGEDERRMSEIAELRGVDQSVVSRQISELQRKEIVCRRPDPTDGRASLVRLTPEGRRIFTNLRDVRQQWLRDALARSSVDAAAATELVAALADELRAHSSDMCRIVSGQ